MTSKEAEQAAIKLGYKKVKGVFSHGQLVFKKGNKFISPDVDGHSGGVWKAADSIKDLAKKETRLGTYDGKLRRIGD